jgi:hypothetical protein
MRFYGDFALPGLHTATGEDPLHGNSRGFGVCMTKRHDQKTLKNLGAAVLLALLVSPANARLPKGFPLGQAAPAGFAFASLATLPAATNGGSWFYKLSTTGGTGAVTFAFNYTTMGTISSIPLSTNAAVTLTGSAAAFSGMSQAYIGGYGSQGQGLTNASGSFNSQTVTITGTSGNVVNTSFNSTNYVLAASGGTLSSGAITGVTPWQLTPQGYLFAAPTVNETATVSIIATDSATPTPHTATRTFTIPVTSALAVMGTSLDRMSQPLPEAWAGQTYGSGSLGYSFLAAGGTGSGQTWSVANLPPGLSMHGATIVGTPTTAGTFTGIVATVTDSGGNSASATFSMLVAANAGVSRPSFNSNAANGLFVLNGSLYGTDNQLITMRGLDRDHFDTGTQAAWSLTGANVVRQALFNGDSDATQEAVTASHIAAGQIPVVVRFGNVQTPPAQTGNSTGSTSLPLLGAMTADWCNNFSTWSPVQSKMMLNVANEWGPTNSANWQTAYQMVSFPIATISGNTITLASSVVGSTNPFAGAAALTYAYISGVSGITSQAAGISATTGGVSGAWTITTTAALGTGTGGTIFGGAVGMLRGVGYTLPIVIDSGGSGQDINDLVNFSGNVFTSDPLKNIVFSFHLYGLGNSFPPGSTVAQMNTIMADLVARRTAVGAVYALLEFGPSTPPGASLPSPTVLTPGQIIQAAEANTIPWAEWAFDDNNLDAAQTSWSWFGLTQVSGTFAKPSDLTPNGLDVILNPTYGVRALAAPASYLL